MVKNEILAQYWTSKEVNDAFDKMHPEELRYDLKAEVFLVLCEMENDKLVGMFEISIFVIILQPGIYSAFNIKKLF